MEAHEIDGDFRLPSGRPDVGERADTSADLDDRDRETRHVGLVEEAQREAFLGSRALLQPVVRDLAQLTERVDRLGWFDDAKNAAVTLEPPNRFPVPSAVAPVERKTLEID